MKEESEFVLVRDIEETAACRICLERGEPDSYMCVPCNCLGSVRYIHRECLEEWIRQCGATECEICHSSYNENWVQWAQENNYIRSHQEVQEQPLGQPGEFPMVRLLWANLCLVFFLLMIIEVFNEPRVISETAMEILSQGFRVSLVLAVFCGFGLTLFNRSILGINMLPEAEFY